MTVYVVTTGNWNDAAFWNGIGESWSGWHTLDFSELPSRYSVQTDTAADVITIGDGSTTFTVGDSGAAGTDANIGGTTALDAFTLLDGGDGDEAITQADDDASGTDSTAVAKGDGTDGDAALTGADDSHGARPGPAAAADGGCAACSEIENIICFTPGTMILTEMGERPIETLRPGDRVVTRDCGAQPIRWIGRRTVAGRGRFAPVRIAPSAMDGTRDGLLVSPQHRILFTGYQAQLLFGQEEVLVPARHLVDGADVRAQEMDEVTYIHLMFDHHEVIYAEGIASESFHAGDIGLGTLCEAAREELFAVFPELRIYPRHVGDTARQCLKPYEARLLMDYGGPMESMH